MDTLKDYVVDIQKQVKNTTTEQLKEIQSQLSQFNILDASQKLIQLDEQLADIIGMIQYMDQTISGKPVDKTMQSGYETTHITKLNEDMFKILDKDYIRTINHLLLSREANNEPVAKLQEIFNIFLVDKSVIDKNMKTYSDLSKAITVDIDARLQSLSTLGLNIDDALIITNIATDTIKNSVFTDYAVDSIAYSTIPKTEQQFQVLIKLDGLKQLIIGYDGMISDATLNTISTAYEHINLMDNEKKLVQALSELKNDMIEVLSKTQPTFQKGGNELAMSLSNFNIELQQSQRKLGLFIASWNEYQQYKLRYYNFFQYHVYCLTQKNQVARKIFIYIDKVTLQKYLDIINGIISKFMVVLDMTVSKDIIKYFNTYHYFTLKKLRKFMKFLIDIIPDGSIIDVMKCKDEVYLSFMLFNQFKDFLEIYDQQIKMKK